MLDFSVSQYPFRFGLAEGVEPHQVQPGTLMTAENVVWKKAGRLEKRFGVSALVATIISGGSIAAASRLFARGDELCLVDGSNLYAYSPGVAKWKSVGAINDAVPTWGTALDTLSGVASSDVAYLSGMLCYVWTTGDPWQNNVNTDVWYQVVDAATGSTLAGPTRQFTGTSYGVRVFAGDGKFVIVMRTGSASPFSIQAFQFILSTFTTTSTVALRTDNATEAGSTIAPWDATMPDSTSLIIGYNRTGPVIALESFTVTPTTFTALASATIVDANSCRAISLSATAGEFLYVAYARGGAVPNALRLAVCSPTTLATSSGPTTLDTPAGNGFTFSVGVSRYDSTHCVIAATTQEAPVALSRLTTYVCTSATAVTTSNNPYYSAVGTSRPWMLNGNAYVAASLFSFGLTGSNSAILLADEYRYLSSVDLLVGGFTSFGGPATSAAVLSSTEVVTTLPFQASITPTKNSWRQGIRKLTLTTGADRPVDAYRTVGASGEAFISGGALEAYDGAIVFDYGFAQTPTVTSSTVTGSGSIAAGSYLYSAVTEFRSGTGLLYRSPAAASITQVTTTASSTNTLAISACNVSNKPPLDATGASGFVNEGIFRSVAGGVTPQRLSFEPRYNTVVTDKFAASQALVDTRADSAIDGVAAALASRPVLYTTGGILDDYGPPGSVTMFLHVDRLWVLAGDKRTWWYSKAFQDDLGTAPGFSPSLRISFDEEQTAGASMDDKAIFFSARGVKYLLGTGPAPNGLNSDFQAPTTIQSDVGCTNPRSVVTTPDGVMFLSDRGIYLLTRGMDLVWIGRAIKDTLAAYPSVTSAVLVAKRNQVRFTCNAADGLSGVVLVFDYVEKQWSVSKYTAADYATPIADACMWNGAWTFVTALGQVYVEDESTYLDDGTYVPMTLETAWISGPQSNLSPSAGPLKFQSVRSFGLNGTSHTDHDLTIDVGFDSNTTYQQTKTFLGGSAVTSVGDLEECTLTIGTRRKCGSIRFRISDATPTTGTVGTGQGPSFDMMALETGAKRGLVTAPATKKG